MIDSDGDGVTLRLCICEELEVPPEALRVGGSFVTLGESEGIFECEVVALGETVFEVEKDIVGEA